MIGQTKNLCVLVPYRDREEHLDFFLPHTRRFLAKQNISFSFLIVEQAPGRAFNKGKLLNVGFAFTNGEYDYYCCHDVDMLPVVADYSYCSAPTHLAVEVEQFAWKLAYPTFFGGVLLCDRESYKLVNGFSNEYWGWGGEDDDFYLRCRAKNLSTDRRCGRFQSLPHQRRIEWEQYEFNRRRLQSFVSSHVNGNFVDGLNSLSFELWETRELADDCRQIKVQL